MKYNKKHFAGILLLSGAAALAVFFMDNGKVFLQNDAGRVVERNAQGEGAKEETYKVQIGEEEKPLTIEVNEQKYTEEELRQIFSEAEDKLTSSILGKNQSLDEVREDLELIEQIPDTGIRVSWEIDNYEVMDTQGKLKVENLTDTGTLVGLKATLTYGEEKAEYSFCANVFAPYQSDPQRLFQRLQQEIADIDKKTQESKVLTLPDSIEGVSVKWKHQINFRAAALLLLGAAAAILLCMSEKQRKKEEAKKREQQMLWDYPQVVNQFTLLLGAGMTAKNAWKQIVEDYEQRKAETGKREVYEEMKYILHEMKSGGSEGECYEDFGRRCGMRIYRKFAAMLSQNLKKGTKGLTVMLKQEAEQAFEDRKNMARRLGEEAGTKMLLPMFLMLTVVLVIMVIPALFSISI